MLRGRWALVALAVMFVASAEAQQLPVFRAGVELLEVDVSVVDDAGEPIADLAGPSQYQHDEPISLDDDGPPAPHAEEIWKSSPASHKRRTNSAYGEQSGFRRFAGPSASY